MTKFLTLIALIFVLPIIGYSILTYVVPFFWGHESSFGAEMAIGFGVFGLLAFVGTVFLTAELSVNPWRW